MASYVLERFFLLVISLVSVCIGKSIEPLSTKSAFQQSSFSTASVFDLELVRGTENATESVPSLNTKGSSGTRVVDKGVTYDVISPSSLSLKLTSSLPKSKRVELPEQPIALPQKDSVKGYIRDDGTYIIEDSAQMPCVLAYFKAKITVYYPTDIKNEKYTNTVLSPPDDVTVSGKCDRDSLIAVLDLIWDQGTFSLRFAFDDLTDSWYVDQFSFVFNTSMTAYKGAQKVEEVKLKSFEKKRFWATSHARSFRCLLLHDVSLVDDDERYSATIHFDEARVQALTKTKAFKTPKHCIHRVHRDEMVPITVGGVLAGLTLVTIVIYGIFRYFKIKKFQYGTME